MNACTEIIALTQDLIRIPSMHSRPEEIMRCADFVLKWCAAHAITARKVVHNGVPSVLVMPQNSVKLLLMTHLDVVDAPESMFHPRVEGDHLFGRGAIDDKYAVALSLVLFRDRLLALKAMGRTQDNMAVGLLITGDEETGGENGAAYALGMVKAQYALALDGGSPERIITREKGIVDIKLTATGKSAHGARPWLGVNAIDLLLADYERIRELFTDQGGEHWHRSINFGKIRAGHSINQVPQTAEGWFDIRFTENDDPDAIVSEIRSRVHSSVEVLAEAPVFASLPSPLTQHLLQIAPGSVLTREHGASDARYLMEHGIPGAIWGAQGFGSGHGLDECVSISSIEHLHKCLSTLVMDLEQNKIS